MSWLDKTLDMLNRFDGNSSELCREIGVTNRWLYGLKMGDWKNPGIRRVQAVHDYIEKHEASKASIQDAA